jgi:hypothetical protein
MKINRILLILAFIPVLAAVSCDDNSAYNQEQTATANNQVRLRANYPLPVLTRSEELENLTRRLNRINSGNMTGCIYLISYGRVMAFYPVDGKVTSLNAYMTAAERVTANGPIELPDLDGAYGQNPDGVFFFTPDDAYVEWKGDYMWSDLCLPLSEQPVMMTEVPFGPTTAPAPAATPAP